MPTATLAPPHVPATGGRSAVLTAGCDGYPGGTTGRVLGHREGCAVFAPSHPERVARWAVARSTLLVPLALVVAAG